MTLADGLTVTTGGLRSALSLLAIMALLVLWQSPPPSERAELFRWRTGAVFAISAVIFSPVHAATLLGFAVPRAVILSADLIATALGCIALITLLAAQALQRAVPMRRVRNAIYLNASIALSFVLVAWTTR